MLTTAKYFHTLAIIAIIILVSFQCSGPKTNNSESKRIGQWEETEITLHSSKTYPNPYTDVEVYADFTLDNQKIRRPAFWDGENVWKIRFASPVNSGEWHWTSFCSDKENSGLNGQSGLLTSEKYAGDNLLIRHGLLKMSPGKRNVIHADGTLFFLVGDTPWALPFRATTDDAIVYARNRQTRGYNAALLMTVQPDMEAEGPEGRDTDQGFERGFYDLSDGHLNNINIGYFQYFDQLRDILINHGIVPVYQPVFQGFGWKGKNVLGRDAVPSEYVRYCRYLVARYGAKPAIWLVSADNNGLDPCIAPAGQEIEKWDPYQQPTGIHYSPFDDYWPDFMKKSQCLHENKSHQDALWLDFQWAQTGHNNEHIFSKVQKMYSNTPTKAVANGEPTYEGIGKPEHGAGWWQGEDAWGQLISGGTMGVVYGAAGLWQWKVSADEQGWPEWADAHASWKDAIELPGSKYPGILGKIINNLDFADIERQSSPSEGAKYLAKPGKLYVCYLDEAKEISLPGLKTGMTFRWYDPKTGDMVEEGKVTSSEQKFNIPAPNPMVLVLSQ